MTKPVFRTLIKIAIGLALLLFIAADLLILWVATGPRTLNTLTPYIEKAFTAEDGSYAMKINQTWLTLGSWRHPIDIRLHDVKVLTKEGAVFSSFPEIFIGLDLFALPMGKILPSSVTINQPAISLFQNEDKSINFGFGKSESLVPAPAEGQTPIPENKITAAPDATVPFAALLAPLLAPDNNSSLRSLHRVTIRGAAISITNVKKGAFFELVNANIKLRKRHGVLGLHVSGDIHYSDHQSHIAADMSLSRDMPTIDGSIRFQMLDPGALAKLFASNPAFGIFNAPLSGKADVSVDREGNIKKIAFSTDGGAGYIHSELLADSLAINALHAEGQLTNNANDIQIDVLSILMGKTTISGSGVVSLNNNDAAIRAHLIATNVPSSDVKLFWPPSLSPESRAWVLGNITDGTVPQAEARVNIQFGDLAKPVLPKEAVDASIALEGAAIRYLPDHPRITNVQGTIYVDGVGLTANIAGGSYMQSTKLSKGKLEIADLNADNPYIKVAFDADTTAKDVVSFLKLPRLQRAQRLGLNTDSVQGTAIAHGTVGFYFFAPTDAHGKSMEPDVYYSVIAEVKDFAQPGFLDKFDISGGTGTVFVDNKGVKFTGSGHVNGASASQAEVSYRFKPEEGFDTAIDVTATAPVESVPRFGYPALPFAKGTLGVKASLKLGPDVETATASINLADTVLDVKYLGWIKPDKEPAGIDIKSEKKNGVMNIPSFRITGQNADVEGSAALSKDFSSVERMSLQKAMLGKTNLTRLEYENTQTSVKIDAAGKSADLSGWLDQDEENSTFSFEHFPALQFKIDIAQLMLSKRGDMRGVKGEMRCDARLCSSANISGTVANNKNFDFRILKNPKGKRQVSLHATDAGAFLKAVGAFPNIEGGDLAITGNFDEGAQGSVLKGRATMTEYTVKKAPVLAKILSLASLTGVVDLMQGNGIRFSKLSAPFTLKNDVFTFRKVRAIGSSIGITTEGTMKFPKRTLDLEGTVVPAYALNNIVGKIPLVGGLLTGGDGGGVFAFSYTVKGTESDPEVSVNPLSILAPGFLRGLFEGADRDEEE